MKTCHVEVFTDGRPLLLNTHTISGANFGEIARKAFALAKSDLTIRHETKQLTIRMTTI